jgi:hypothetical protein
MLHRCAALAVVMSSSGCGGADTTMPDRPLDITVIARTIDGAPLPALLEEYAGATVQVVQFQIHLSPDGLWFGSGSRRPLGGASGDTAVFQDNGWYQSDGTTVLLHSNFTHNDSPGNMRDDTLLVRMQLPVADAAHEMVLSR